MKTESLPLNLATNCTNLSSSIAVSRLNEACNLVHKWGKPDQHPLKRMFLSRMGMVGTAVLEMGYIATLILKFSNPRLSLNLSDCLFNIVKLVAGIASAFFMGALFSPELGYRLHVKLGLALPCPSTIRNTNLNCASKCSEQPVAFKPLFNKEMTAELENLFEKLA